VRHGHLLQLLHKASFDVPVFTKHLASSFFKLANIFSLSCAFTKFDIMAVVLAFCAFKIGRKFLRHVQAVSDPISYSLCNMPKKNYTKNSNQATNQGDPELATPPVVINSSSSNTIDAAPVVVSTARCCQLCQLHLCPCPYLVYLLLLLQVPHATATAPVQDNTPANNDINDHDVSPAAESPEVAPEPMATPAAAAPATNDSQALQDTTTAPQDTTTTNLATAIATVYRRRTGPKAASKPLADYSLLAPHMRQMEVEWVKKDKAHIDALKACRLQVANCSWYQEIHN
jgi:hypothetical protein